MARPSDSCLALLADLVGFDTVSHRSNADLIAFVRDFLTGHGIESRLDTDATGRKSNLFATIGPKDRGGLMLAGHTDVVPVEGQDWTSDPFRAVERGDKLFGRGTCDMKGFIAATLAMVPSLAAAPLRVPVHLAFTFDEEIGCFGAQSLADLLRGLDHRPVACIVGEPTSMSVVCGHKGKLSVDCHVHGREGHSAFVDRGVNAVEIAAELIAALRAHQRRLRYETPADPRFDPPFTTIHTGHVDGGVARNIVPRDCRFEFEIRNIPGFDPLEVIDALRRFAGDDLLPEMQAIAADTGIDFDIQSHIPALDPDEGSAILSRALALTGDNAPGHVSFATEAGIYQGTGIPTIVCGPGNITEAHRADEFVTLDQLAKCEAFLADVVAGEYRS